MSLTLSRVKDSYDTHGRHSSIVYDVTFDSSYPTGGEAVAARDVTLREILGARIIGYKDATSGGYEIKWDYDSLKLMAFRSAGFTPAGTVAAPAFTGTALAAHRHSLFVATGATDATGARVNAATNSFAMNNAAATVAGIAAASGSAGGVVDITAGTPAGTNSAPAFTGTAVDPTALVEVSNGVSLASVTVRVEFYGIG